MTKFLRTTCLVASVAATAITAVPAAAAPVAATTPATARARIIKPLTLTATGQLDFGTLSVPAGGVAANRTISLSNANVRDCTAAPDVTCSGTTSVPTYNVKGTNKEVVQVIKTGSTLTGSNGGTLALSLTGPTSVTLPNSGNAGTDFTIGGDVVVTPTTVDGLYTGTLNVTVDY